MKKEPTNTEIMAEIKKLAVLVGLLVYSKDHQRPWVDDCAGKVADDDYEADNYVMPPRMKDDSIFKSEEEVFGPLKKRGWS